MSSSIIKRLAVLTLTVSLVVFGMSTATMLQAGVETPIPWLPILLSGLSSTLSLVAYKFSGPISRFMKGFYRQIFPGKNTSEEQVLEEICRRILEKARQQSGQAQKEADLKATLDALEIMVDLPREEMEEIARTVQKEFQKEEKTASDIPKSRINQAGTRPPWPAIIFLVITYSLMRRGSPWYLVTGLLFLVLAVRFLVHTFNRHRD